MLTLKKFQWYFDFFLQTALKSPSKPEAASMNAVRRRLPLTIDDDSVSFLNVSCSCPCYGDDVCRLEDQNRKYLQYDR